MVVGQVVVGPLVLSALVLGALVLGALVLGPLVGRFQRNSRQRRAVGSALSTGFQEPGDEVALAARF